MKRKTFKTCLQTENFVQTDVIKEMIWMAHYKCTIIKRQFSSSPPTLGLTNKLPVTLNIRDSPKGVHTVTRQKHGTLYTAKINHLTQTYSTPCNKIKGLKNEIGTYILTQQ